MMGGMALTIDYAGLRAAAPGKRRSRRAAKPVEPRPPRAERQPYVAARAAHLTLLPVPAGVRRYYLKVPRNRDAQARAAGCQWDASVNRWYVDNPVLSDFTAWQPTLLQYVRNGQQEPA